MNYILGDSNDRQITYPVRLWFYSKNDRILIKAIQENYKKPANWQFQQPTMMKLSLD